MARHGSCHMFSHKILRRCVYTKKATGSALPRPRVLEKRSQQAGHPTSLFKHNEHLKRKQGGGGLGLWGGGGGGVSDFKIRTQLKLFVSYTMRLLFLMFVTAVCVLLWGWSGRKKRCGKEQWRLPLPQIFSCALSNRGNKPRNVLQQVIINISNFDQIQVKQIVLKDSGG